MLEVELPTYDGEYFHVASGRPITVSVVGRLDSFASSTLVRLWSAVPSPKRVLFHLDERAEISAPGWAKLMSLVSPRDGTDRATVLLDADTQFPEGPRASVAPAAGVHSLRTAAVDALGELGPERPWMARVD